MSYLHRQPNAEDTLEGITRWWLLEEEIRIESHRVEEALRRLVEREHVSTVARVDGRTAYRLARERGA